VVGGSLEVSPATPGLIAFLRNALGSTRRIASICVAAFTLAEAGLLAGRRATTHWFYARDLQNRFPKIKVEADRIFIADGSVWTSAGMTAGVDLALGMVERDIGDEAARHVAPGQVFIPFCYAEAAANVLTNPQLDPFGKIPEFKFCAAKVEPAAISVAAE
jgi:transcriptional regulator GlxA family with amidase domain